MKKTCYKCLYYGVPIITIERTYPSLIADNFVEIEKCSKCKCRVYGVRNE